MATPREELLEATKAIQVAVLVIRPHADLIEAIAVSRAMHGQGRARH